MQLKEIDSLQKVFDHVATHLLPQGEKAVNSQSNFRYREGR